MTSDSDVLEVAVCPKPRVSILDTPPVRTRKPSMIAGIGAVFVHVALVMFAMLIGTSVAARTAKTPVVTQMFEVELSPQATPELPKEPEEAPETLTVRTPAPRSTNTAKTMREQPQATTAQTVESLTTNEEVLDFGDAFIAGKSASSAGGITQGEGTARASGASDRTGTDGVRDLGRAPLLASGAVWDCSFPPEADDDAIDHAVVTLHIEIGADGRVLRARATSDPGSGFGREARRCAFSKRWAPGLDRTGKPTTAVAIVNVRFDR